MPEDYESARSGYPGADLTQRTFLPGFDYSLLPFDQMSEATVNASRWTQVAVYVLPAREYGFLQWFGVDGNNPLFAQTTSFRLLRAGGAAGGDQDGLIRALESRCGILDGQMCPWPLFLKPGEAISIEAMTTTGEQTVRARLKGVRRAASPEMG